MKHNFKITTILLIIVLSIFACKKTEKNFTTEGEFSFQVNINTQKSSSDELNASYVLVTIKDMNNDYVYNLEKIELYNFNGYYISKPVSLITGEYKLTQFFVLNDVDDVIYASPVEGSEFASLVDEPLPIEFNIYEDQVTKLTPEVLSVSNSCPADFGYVNFSFEIVETFDFLLGVFVYNDSVQNFELTDYHIDITADNKLLLNSDLGNITNHIRLNAGYDGYIMKISKAGYKTYEHLYTIEELSKHTNDPLEIILEKGESDTIVIIQPNGQEGKDAFAWDYRPENNFGNTYEFTPYAWTYNGTPTIRRCYLEFDLTQFSSGTEISKAYLTLYNDPTSPSTDGRHQQLSGSNELVVQRVLSGWDENTITWNNQPVVSTDNQIILPPSSDEHQNYFIDVSDMVQYMINHPELNYGFCLKLLTEQYYRSTIFASSDHQNSKLHPKLEIIL